MVREGFVVVEDVQNDIPLPAVQGPYKLKTWTL